MENIKKIIEEAPNNDVIFKSLLVTDKKLNSQDYNNIMCSVSGGSDSDILLDLCSKVDKNGKVKYVFFNTGLEYQATKDHIKYLNEKYGIEIIEKKPIKPIPICVKEYGSPFVSKYVSEMISRLQKHNFKWEDKSYDELIKEYPNCKSALKWWTNGAEKKTNGSESSFNIGYNKYLKEFLIENPPHFKISNKCCKFAKKDIAHNFKKENDIDLSITGVRKAEGGIRSTAYKNCFTQYDDKCDEYRGIFWYKDSDKEEYEKAYGVTHSDCYTVYGLKRTGCIGCPYGRDFENELNVLQKYEPKLYKAVISIFGESYEYTRKFKEFKRKMKEESNKL